MLRWRHCCTIGLVALLAACGETSAPEDRWVSTRAGMSRPVRMSPLKMSTGSPGAERRREATLRMAPPVPRGSSSVTYSMWSPIDEPSPK
jgi:hypothetical protein